MLTGDANIEFADKLNQTASGGVDKSHTITQINKPNYLQWYNIFLHAPLDIFDFGKNVINKNSIEPLAFLTLSTAAAMLVDQKEWQNTKIVTNRSHILPGITKGIVNIGDGRWQFGAAGVGVLSGLIFQNRKIVNTSFESIEAILSTGLFVQVAKRITGRQSPAVANRSSGIWELFVDPVEYQHDQPNFYSFPSGHLAGAAAILTVITENYPEIKWLKPVSYIILGGLGFSLVANDMHWYSDFPVGLATGYLFGEIISSRYEKNHNDESEQTDKLSIEPLIYPNKIGVFLSYSL
jgi:membrane-associated phospholipid phosphatase